MTDKLSKAFQLVEIPVSKEMIEEEKNIINDSFILSQERLKEALKKISETINFSDYVKSMKFEIKDVK